MNATTVTLILGALALIALIALITLCALHRTRREVESLFAELRALREEVSREADACAGYQDKILTTLTHVRQDTLEMKYSQRRGEPLVAPRTPEQRSETTVVSSPVELDIEPIEPSELAALANLLD